MQVCVRDETPSGQSLWELSLEFLNERITVRELLRERVYHEVQEFNRQQDRRVFHGLVQPEDAELTLHGSKRIVVIPPYTSPIEQTGTDRLGYATAGAEGVAIAQVDGKPASWRSYCRQAVSMPGNLTSEKSRGKATVKSLCAHCRSSH
jgi:hypothetical protein